MAYSHGAPSLHHEPLTISAKSQLPAHRAHGSHVNAHQQAAEQVLQMQSYKAGPRQAESMCTHARCRALIPSEATARGGGSLPAGGALAAGLMLVEEGEPGDGINDVS